MSDEFEADNYAMFAPDLRVTKLGPGGEWLFSAEQGRITFHKSGVYEVRIPATVRMLEDAEPGDYEHNDEPPPEVQRAAHLGIARSWVLDGTLSLDELIGSLEGVGAKPYGRNEDEPWSLRQWALLARQTMEQQAEQCDVLDALLSSMPGMTIERRPRRIAVHAVKTLREVVAEYPEDLDAIQAEQATRNADSEAVRRLAHAMVEAANELETEHAVISRGTPHAVRMERLASKLRDTVNTWTTEKQRRPWAQTVTGIDPTTADSDGAVVTGECTPDGKITITKVTNFADYVSGTVTRQLARTMRQAADGLERTYLPGRPPMVVAKVIEHLRTDSAPWLSDAEQTSQGEPAVWWIDHAGCRHSVDSHRGQQAGGGCRATGCDCKASTDGLRRRCDLVEPEPGQAPRGDEGAAWVPDVVFRDVLEALHQAEWLTRHLRGSLPSDYIGPNNELNRSVRRLLGLGD